VKKIDFKKNANSVHIAYGKMTEFCDLVKIRKNKKLYDTFAWKIEYFSVIF